MRVLMIFWANPGDPSTSTLTKDLAQEFSYQGHDVTVVIPLEEKFNKPTYLAVEKDYKALYVKTGNYFNLDSKIEKAMTTFTIGNALLKGIMQHLADEKFDLIISRAPFLADPKLIVPLKKHYNCPAHLLLFDIFPQTAWDMGIIKSKLIYSFFKHKEKQMLDAFSVIWCTSPGNAKYMSEHHPKLANGRIEWVYNYGFIKPAPGINRSQMRKDFGYTDTDFIALFGGNMGVPQKLENILLLAKEALILKNAKFMFIGVGTEKKRMVQMATDMKLDNIKFIDYVPREKYELLAASCDIGLVSLDERFTIPNFPSKTTDYFKLSLPILGSLDKSAASDYGRILQNEVHAGFYAISGDIPTLFEQYKKLYEDPALRKSMGEKGRKFYEQELDVSVACKKIVNKFLQDRDQK